MREQVRMHINTTKIRNALPTIAKLLKLMVFAPAYYLLGGVLIIPVAMSIICIFLLTMIFESSRKIWNFTAGIQMGYMIWLLITWWTMYNSYARTTDQILVLGSVAIILLSVIWIYNAPGLWPTAFIVSFHCMTFVDSAIRIWIDDLSRIVIRVGVVHELFRSVIVLTIIMAFLEHRRAVKRSRTVAVAEVFD